MQGPWGRSLLAAALAASLLALTTPCYAQQDEPQARCGQGGLLQEPSLRAAAGATVQRQPTRQLRFGADAPLTLQLCPSRASSASATGASWTTSATSTSSQGEWNSLGVAPQPPPPPPLTTASCAPSAPFLSAQVERVAGAGQRAVRPQLHHPALPAGAGGAPQPHALLHRWRRGRAGAGDRARCGGEGMWRSASRTCPSKFLATRAAPHLAYKSLPIAANLLTTSNCSPHFRPAG